MKNHPVLSIFFVVLMATSSCTKPEANKQQEDTKLKELCIDFEKSWGQSGAEVDSLRNAIAGLPGIDACRLYCRSWKKAREKRFPIALKTADSLVMGFPKFEKGLFLRASLRLENGDTNGSVSDFEKCLQRNPGFFEARMNRGALFFSRKMPDLAFQDFKQAVSLKPEHAGARQNLGNAFLALGQADSACRCWKDARLLGSPDALSLLDKFCGKKPE